MLEFIQELTESRLFRHEDDLNNNSAESLGRLLYMGVLSLEMLTYINEREARAYANRSIQYNEFDKMRPSATDLANLIAVLSNQDNYKNRIQVNTAISPPVLQLKQYLRSLSQNASQHAYNRMMLMNLEGQLRISQQELRQIRRVVGDWKSADKTQHNLVIKQLTRDISMNAPLFDMLILLKKHA